MWFMYSAVIQPRNIVIVMICGGASFLFSLYKFGGYGEGFFELSSCVMIMEYFMNEITK